MVKLKSFLRDIAMVAIVIIGIVPITIFGVIRIFIRIRHRGVNDES